MDYTVHGILQARILEWVAFPFSRGSSHPRDGTQVSHISGDSLPDESPGEPKNTEVGSLSLLQIFPTQELNWDLLHCRQILYQLSYQGGHLKECWICHQHSKVAISPPRAFPLNLLDPVVINNLNGVKLPPLHLY